jgi:hypothetical protein
MSARVARRVGIRFGKYTNRERVERKDLWPMSVMPLSMLFGSLSWPNEQTTAEASILPPQVSRFAR